MSCFNSPLYLINQASVSTASNLGCILPMFQAILKPVCSTHFFGIFFPRLKNLPASNPLHSK